MRQVPILAWLRTVGWRWLSVTNDRKKGRLDPLVGETSFVFWNMDRGQVFTFMQSLGCNYSYIPKRLLIEVWGWISNFTSIWPGHMITYLCWDKSWSMLIKTPLEYKSNTQKRLYTTTNFIIFNVSKDDHLNKLRYFCPRYEEHLLGMLIIIIKIIIQKISWISFANI